MSLTCLSRSFVKSCAVSVCALLASASLAQTFQVVVAETPAGSGGGQPVERFAVSSITGQFNRLSDITGDLVDDPVGVAFRSPQELLVANRYGHAGGGSISTFYFGEDFTTYTVGPVITGNGLTDVVQIAFNPADGELFAPNFPTGVLSRFVFDASGNATANGTIQMPDGGYQLCAAIRLADQQLFVSNYGFVRRFLRGSGGSYTHHANFSIPGASSIHFMRFRGDELYVCDIYTNRVYRFLFDPNGDPIPNGYIDSNTPIDVAFSPNGGEMYVASHVNGGVSRFAYVPETNGWSYIATVPTPSMGGIAVTALAACYGDLDGDRNVGIQDLAILLAHFGVGGSASYHEGNMDGAAGVELQDLALLLAEFGKICE